MNANLKPKGNEGAEPADERLTTGQRLEKLIDDYLDGYILEGDGGGHAPGKDEQFVMKDAIMGLIADEEFQSVFAAQAESRATAPTKLSRNLSLDEIAQMHRGAHPPASAPALPSRVDGEGFEVPLGEIYRLACCDCGLVHDVVWEYEDGKLGMAAQRNEVETAKRRGAMPEPAAWLHAVKQHGDDEEDQALSFAPDNFPFKTDEAPGFYSTGAVPLYLRFPASAPEPIPRAKVPRYAHWQDDPASAPEPAALPPLPQPKMDCTGVSVHNTEHLWEWARACFEVGRQQGMRQEHALWQLAHSSQEIEAAHPPASAPAWRDDGKQPPPAGSGDRAATPEQIAALVEKMKVAERQLSAEPARWAIRGTDIVTRFKDVADKWRETNDVEPLFAHPPASAPEPSWLDASVEWGKTMQRKLSDAQVADVVAGMKATPEELAAASAPEPAALRERLVDAIFDSGYEDRQELAALIDAALAAPATAPQAAEGADETARLREALAEARAMLVGGPFPRTGERLRLVGKIDAALASPIPLEVKTPSSFHPAVPPSEEKTLQCRCGGVERYGTTYGKDACLDCGLILAPAERNTDGTD